MIEKYDVTTPEKGDSSMSDPTNDANNEDEDMSDEEDDDVDEELTELNSHLDKLGTALDVLEKKNDDIQAQLVELLEANRRVKMQFRDESAPKEEPSKE